MRSSQERSGGDVSCYDVLHDVDSAMRDSMLPEHGYYVLGGIASGALAHPDTFMDKESRTVIPVVDSAISTIRSNGTRRDIDILVSSVLSEPDAERIKSAVRETVRDQLVVSVFGFDKHIPHPGLRQRIAGRLGAWVSSRTIDNEGIMRYELFPLARTVEPESYEPWKLRLPAGGTVEMLHPAGHTLAYRLRSISGPRFKDKQKREAMEANVLPRFAEEVADGPFRGWMEFSQDIKDLSDGWISSESVRSNTPAIDIRTFRAKSYLLRQAESHDAIVNIGQQDIVQKALNLVVRAK